METLSNLIPTDNLYRFLSISGILIFGFCFFYPEYRIYQLSQSSISISGEQDILGVSIDEAESKIKQYTDQINYIAQNSSEDIKNISRISKINPKKLSSSDINKYKSSLSVSGKELNNKLSELDNVLKLLDSQQIVLDSIRVRNLRQKTLSKLMMNDGERLNRLSNIAVIGQLVGFLMSVTGFVCWYIFIQMPQDKLLKHQTSDLNKKKT